MSRLSKQMREQALAAGRRDAAVSGFQKRGSFFIASPPTGLDGPRVTYSRVGRWAEAAHYTIGRSQVRLFSGIAEPVIMNPETDFEGSRDKAKQAAEWGLQQTRDMRACAYAERIDFPAAENVHLVVTGFYNVTTGDSGWAALFTRESNTQSGAFLSNIPDKWFRKSDWFTPWWRTGTDQIEITLQYADKDGAGLVWFWYWKQ